MLTHQVLSAPYYPHHFLSLTPSQHLSITTNTHSVSVYIFHQGQAVADLFPSIFSPTSSNKFSLEIKAFHHSLEKRISLRNFVQEREGLEKIGLEKNYDL